jgi:hypothetical protein
VKTYLYHNGKRKTMRCSKCILPETIPGISFDEDGVCNYCKSYNLRFSNWAQERKKKTRQLVKILEYSKKLKRPYDCLVPLSGGKDSTYVLYLLSEKYNMRCLCVTFDHGFMSDQAKINIKNATERMNSHHIYFSLSQEKTIKMFKHFFQKTGGFCASCMRGINYTIETAAHRYNIPLVVKGSGRRVQYVSQIEKDHSNSALYFKNVMSNLPNLDEYKRFFPNLKNYEFSKLVELILDTLRIPAYLMMRFIPYYLGLYDYVYEPYEKIVRLLEQEMGWSRKDETIEHLDCVFHDVPTYLRTLRMKGITKDTLYNSGLVRQGIITRDEAIRVEQLNMQNSKPPEGLELFLQLCNIPQKQFVEYLQNSEPQKYRPLIEKIATDLYLQRILGDKD